MFHSKTLQLHLKQQDQPLIDARWEAFQGFKAKAEQIRKLKEEQYQDGFLRDVFVGALGYTLRPDDGYNLSREEKNENDAKKADGVIFTDGKITGVIELKGQDTKDLDRPKTRGGHSPVDQLFGYLSSHANARYGVVSNFDELRFYIEKRTEYQGFDLFTLDKEEFTLLHLLLSHESVSAGLPERLKKESDEADKAVSKQLYKDYALFRQGLFENIRANNPALDPSHALRLTQKLVDRIVFILFAEDTGLLRKHTIKEIRSRHKDDIVGLGMYGYYKIYFKAVNEGNEKLEITRYNGGLFADDPELDALKIDDGHLDMQAQKLSDYDFASDVSVNILGHIFEQSLTDLEELLARLAGADFDAKKSKRKKDGVFYTPEYITRYMVENTLGRLCEEKRQELKLDVEIEKPQNPKRLGKTESRTLENLKAYRSWLLDLKICDPACGSGAFLNQALDYLINEHTNLRDQILLFGDLTAHMEIEKSILENNLYGVDLNEDAAEIAKLSLWLRTAHRGRELTKLAGKIKVGNSLVSDKAVDPKAFDWEGEFPEVFERGGFDVVVGNPPYVRQEMLAPEAKEYFKTAYATYHGAADLYVFFVEKGYNLLRETGKFGYIFPNKWMRAGYGKPLRHWLKTRKIEEIVDFGDLPVFEDATTYPLILAMERGEAAGSFHILNVETLDFPDLGQYVRERRAPSLTAGLDDEGWTLADAATQRLMDKIRANGVPLGEYVGGKIYRGVLTGLNEAFVIDEETKSRLIAQDPKSEEVIKPFLAGRDVKRYETPKAEKFLILFPKGWTRKESGHAEEAPAWEWLQGRFPAVAGWLEPFAKKARKRSDQGEFWWELRACDYYEKFEEPKIMYQVFQVKPAFVYDTNGTYCNNAMWMLPKEDKALLAILNSKIGWLLISTYCTAIQNGYQLIWKYLEQIPIPEQISAEERHSIEVKVNSQLDLSGRLSKTQGDFTDYLTHALKLEKLTKKLQSPETLTLEELTTELKKKKVNMDDFTIFRSVKSLHEEMAALKEEIDRTDREIDRMVYELYGLTEEEIRIVEEHA